MQELRNKVMDMLDDSSLDVIYVSHSDSKGGGEVLSPDVRDRIPPPRSPGPFPTAPS